ncbi:MAG: HD domain-containing phosphohydrolase [Actinomycetota bacterium]
MSQPDLRLADLLAALSVSTDLAMGQAPEKAIRACVVGTEIARRLGLPDHQVSDVYYATLLKHLGCTATPHEELLFGPDELATRRVAERTDVANSRELLTLLRSTGTGTGPARIRYLARALTSKKENAEMLRAICEVATRLAERLRLGTGVEEALFQNLERWDGKGEPRKLAGDEIALPARIAEPATQMVIFHGLGGIEAATAMLDRRAGGWFDPTVAEAARAAAPEILERLDGGDPWAIVLEAEPRPARRVPETRLDEVAAAFGDMIDLKSTFTPGHSSGVAELAAGAAGRIGLDDTSIRRAAALHDLGRAAVPIGIWEKPGPLTASEWERVRVHAYQTERILARSEALSPLAPLAGMHHERQDGSGYHRGTRGGQAPPEARVIAAADVYQALTQARPHRPAGSREEAAEVITAEASAGRLDPECAGAVIEVAGHRQARRTTWPAGLSDREVEVLRLLASGLANKAIAGRLSISPRTAEHHVQHIYAKIGASTRASATLFGMEHGLLRE